MREFSLAASTVGSRQTAPRSWLELQNPRPTRQDLQFGRFMGGSHAAPTSSSLPLRVYNILSKHSPPNRFLTHKHSPPNRFLTQTLCVRVISEYFLQLPFGFVVETPWPDLVGWRWAILLLWNRQPTVIIGSWFRTRSGISIQDLSCLSHPHSHEPEQDFK